jgi:predicted lipid-binding transport protein (Tim44 family)
VSRANETDTESERPPRPTRAQRLVAAGFLGAFGLTIITVLLTGLEVGSPGTRRAPEPAPAGAAPSHRAFAPSPAAAERRAEARAAEPATGAAGSGNGNDEGEDSAPHKETGEPTSPAR